LMKSAGCEWTGMGVESVSPIILKNMRKGNYKQYKEQAEAAIRYTKEAGIWCNCTFIIGYPGETWATIKETAQFMKDNDVLNNIFYATAYPSTELYCEEKNKILAKYETEDEYIKSLGDATEFRVNYSELSDEELQYARRCAIAGKPGLINQKSFKDEIEITPEFDPLLNKELFERTAR